MDGFTRRQLFLNLLVTVCVAGCNTTNPTPATSANTLLVSGFSSVSFVNETENPPTSPPPLSPEQSFFHGDSSIEPVLECACPRQRVSFYTICDCEELYRSLKDVRQCNDSFTFACDPAERPANTLHFYSLLNESFAQQLHQKHVMNQKSETVANCSSVDAVETQYASYVGVIFVYCGIGFVVGFTVGYIFTIYLFKKCFPCNQYNMSESDSNPVALVAKQKKVITL